MESILPELATVMVEAPARELADFDEVVRLYQPGVFRFILASLRDRDAAETLTQECFLRAFRARDRFCGEASVKTWLMRIAVNQIRDHLSSERLKFWRRTQRSGIDLSIASDWLTDHKSSPEAAVEAKQKVEAVWQAVGELSQNQRTVFLLRFVEELEILQIAAITGMKEGTVKIHLFRALRAVRAKVEKHPEAKK